MRYIRSSTIVTKCIFGVSLFNNSQIELWDYTTLILCKGIKKYLRDQMRIWDLGCGHAAILSLYIMNHARAEILATDWEPTIVTSARKIISTIGVHVKVLESDLTEGINDTFDMILFNAPYLPQKEISRLAKNKKFNNQEYTMFVRRFSGGINGLDTITRFLKEVPKKLHPGGLILLGYNAYYISTSIIEQLINNSNLEHVDCISAWWNPSRVFVIRNRK